MNNRISLALFLAGFATFSLLYAAQPVLPDLVRTFQIQPATSSLALSLATGSLAVAIVMAGAWSEGRDRKRLMLASIVLAALLNLLAAWLPSWPGVLVARTLSGLALGGVPAVAMAHLADELPPDALGRSMGLYVAGTAFGGMSGRMGVSLLSDGWGWRVGLSGVALVALLAAVAFAWLLPAARPPAGRSAGSEPTPDRMGWSAHIQAWRTHWHTPGIAGLVGIAFLGMGSFVTVYNYIGFHLMAAPYHLSAATLSLVFLAYVFGIGSSSLAGTLQQRWGRGPVMGTGLALCLLGLLLSLSTPLALVVAGVVVLTFGFFLAHAVASGWVGSKARAFKGHAASLYLLAYYIGSSVMGSLGGLAWQAGQWTGVAAFTAALLVLALLCARHVMRQADSPCDAAAPMRATPGR